MNTKSKHTDDYAGQAAGETLNQLQADSATGLTDAEAEAVEDTLEWEDIFPLFLAGGAAAGLIFFLRSFGRWIPRP